MTIRDFERDATAAPGAPTGTSVASERYQDLNSAQREAQSMNRIGQLICAAMGPMMIVLFGIGAVWLSGFWPPEKLPGATPLEMLSPASGMGPP